MTASGKQKIIWLAVILILALAALVSWASFGPEALKPVYDITMNVTHLDGTQASFQIATTAETLYEAQADLDLIQCVEIEYEDKDNDEGEGDVAARLFVTDVDGETARTSLGQYWMWNRNGDYSYYDIDQQPIADDDVFDFYIYTYEAVY